MNERLGHFLDSAETSAWVALTAVEYFAVLMAVLCCGRFFYKILLRAKGVNLDEELTGYAKASFGPPTALPNRAMGIAMAGYMIGLAIASSGGIYATVGPEWKMAVIALVGLSSIVLIKLSLILNDALILDRFRNISEITKDHNVGVAWVEAGSCVASGLMIFGVVSGPATSILEKVKYGLAFWCVGQALLVIGARAYFKMIEYDVEDALQSDNAPVGAALGGFLCGLGFILQAAFMGATSHFFSELGTIVVFFTTGLVLLIGSRIITDRVMMPTAPLKDQVLKSRSVGAGAIAAMGFIAVAIMFATAVSPANSFAMHANDDQPVIMPVVAEPETAAK